MKITAIIASCLCLACMTACTQPPLDIVRIDGGSVQGIKDSGLTVFKGIPFAAPPVGERRWKAPQAVEPWEGVKQTIEFAASPYQPGEPPAGKSEDCLDLNVWVPAPAADEKLPVLVWIYN